MITDKPKSYDAAKRESIPGVEHRSNKGLNNRAESLHLAIRRREQGMMRFMSARQCQRFVSIHGPITNIFHLHRKHLTAADQRDIRAAAIAVWSEVTLSMASRSSPIVGILCQTQVKATQPYGPHLIATVWLTLVRRSRFQTYIRLS